MRSALPNFIFERRQFLTGAAATLAAATLPRSALPLPLPTLASVASSKGVLFGSEIGHDVAKDPQFVELVANQCSIVVPGWVLKWGALRPSPEQFDFQGSDAYVQFAKANHLLARGHTLVWQEALPDWFDSVVNPRNARKILQNHISTVARRYAGKLHSWDVVNEVVQIQDGRRDGLRTNPWLRLMGSDYIALAFFSARESDPNAFLVYNENQLEMETAYAEVKRQHVLALLRELRKTGVPIHALGIQSHLPAEGPLGGPNFKRFLQEVSDLGLAILITEMDVFDQSMVGDIAQRDALVAARYDTHLRFMLQFTSVKAVLTWGLSNRYTWLTAHSPRKDGLPVRPLPFDADLKPTAACEAIRLAFEEAPARSPWIPQLAGDGVPLAPVLGASPTSEAGKSLPYNRTEGYRP